MEWPFLASMSEPERGVLLGAARRRAFARGDVLVHESDPADSVHFVAEGRLAVKASLPTGDSVMLSILAPGRTSGSWRCCAGTVDARPA